MKDIRKVLEQYGDKKAAVYGLSTETERFLSEFGDKVNIIGLLDGFREEGEMYGYPIISLQSAAGQGISVVIVVARPGSCKAIAKRIEGICREHGIALYDVRGKDLLASQAVCYDFSHIAGESKGVLLDKIAHADVVSFDLFGTLVMRKVMFYTDIFEILEERLKEQGIYIPDFARLRVSAEKELSRRNMPTLLEIHEELLRRAGGSFVSADELADMEWEMDFSSMLPREEVCNVFRSVVASGKRVFITTDSYYGKELVEKILDAFHLSGYEELFVSCEMGTSKTMALFDRIAEQFRGASILHIGDDEVADVEAAAAASMDTYRVLSGVDLYYALGGMGVESAVQTLSDRVKVGLFISRMFNNPFVFEQDAGKVFVSDSFDVGYLFCAPMISDFTLWMNRMAVSQGIHQILFCARDGFLIGRLYHMLDKETRSIYFLASRIAAIRAGMTCDEDISYVDSMKYFGSDEDCLRVRFGIDAGKIYGKSRNDLILNRAESLQQNYKKYISKLEVADEEIAMFDFVAKGTTQLYLSKLFSQHIKGFYFLQLEPEFMADKGLDIEPYYSDVEKNTSAIFDNYYILETMLTSPYPATEEFDEEGNPSYSEETRSIEDILCFERAQKGIASYFKDYIHMLPKRAWSENKKLDEVFLALVNRVEITDEDFLALTVEDPFFGRMTDIKNVIG